MKLTYTSVFSYLRLAVAGTLAVAAAALALSSFSTRPTIQFGEHHGGSAAFLKHTEDLFAARVGPVGESPASWADENYQLNGGDQITARNISGARAAFNVIQKSGLGQGKTSTSSWFSLGPKNAIYPAFLNRHGSQYVTSGRITALAISPTCTLNSCTLWVGAAGGGVWRTDKALGGANWVNVSDTFFGSGAIGALTYDAAHSTLYAGTGEDAAAGDAEAGVGVYKSTDGGKTWTALGGNSNCTNRATRTIAVDNFNDSTGHTIYVTSGRGLADPARNARYRRLEVDRWRRDLHAAPAQQRQFGRAVRSDVRIELRIVPRRNGVSGRSDARGRDLRVRLQPRRLAFD